MSKGKRERAFDAQIRPLVSQISRLAGEHQIPYVMTFQLTSPRQEAPATMSSSWFVPAGCTETLTELLDRAVPDWRQIQEQAP